MDKIWLGNSGCCILSWTRLGHVTAAVTLVYLRHFQPARDCDNGVILGRVSCLVVCGVALHHSVCGGVTSVNMVSRTLLYEFQRK